MAIECLEILYIVMPAYNEEKNIEAAVKSWYPILLDKGTGSKLVVADSGSCDKTHEMLVNMKKEYPRLEILSNTHKQHGPKVIALYDYSIRQGADYIFQTDSDGQTEPGEFSEFWNMRKQFDAVVGKCTAREDGAVRVLVEHVVCLLLRYYFGVWFRMQMHRSV